MPHQMIADKIWKIEVPLPNNPLRATNAYLIRGKERNLLIDTGFNQKECLDALTQALDALRVHAEDTDIFVTHMHADHSGLVGHLAGKDTRIYMSRVDGQITLNGRNDPYWEKLKQFYTLTGLASLGLVDEVSAHPGYAFASPPMDAVVFVEDGQELKVGDYRFACLETKGHTAGHMCLYEPSRRMLFSGDHILGKITPNITLVDFKHDSLAAYLKSLDAVAAMEVDATHPGHRESIADCGKRIAELKSHHEERLAEAMAILSGGAMNAVDVTRRMQWSIRCPSWDDFPQAQKLFSTGEALSHLFHLVNRGMLSMRREDGGIVYFEKSAG